MYLLNKIKIIIILDGVMIVEEH